MTPSEEVRAMLDKALRIVMGNLQEVADEAGVSYSTLRAWADGRRNPSPDNLRKVAAVLERRGGELQAIAHGLREEANR